MRKLGIVGLALMLAGCAGEYDAGALASANAQQQLALDRCNSRLADSTFTSMGQYTECELAAERDMVAAIKLRKMDVFEAYSARMRLTAQMADARQISPQQMVDQFKQARADFDGQIYQAAAYDAQQQARAAVALAAFGQAMQTQAAIDAASQRSLNCTSTTFVNTVQTHCN